MKEEDLKKCCKLCKNENSCEHKDEVLSFNFIVCPLLQHKEYKNYIVVPPRHQKIWWANLNVDKNE